MASIRKKTLADGSVKYKAEIVIKKSGIVIHRESKTFDKLKTAKDWGMRREVELQNTGVYKDRDYLSIKSVIEQYNAKFPPTGRTKKADLLALCGRDIAKLNVHKLNSADLIKHIIKRNEECKPQTANNDLIWLNQVIKTMKGVIELDTDLRVFESAREVLRNKGLIAKSEHRDRRPTRKELWALSRYFGLNSWMLHIMWFAIYSARRQSEITLIEWDDIKHDDRTCIIRNLKHPTIKGMKKRCKLPRSAYKIIMRQDRVSRFVFPRNPKTISKYFTDACKALGIEGLHYHDLRHEGASRLFEKGLTVVQVQQVTLHSNWATLERYTNLNPGDVDI